MNEEHMEIIHKMTITGTSLSYMFDNRMSKFLGRGYLPCGERVITKHEEKTIKVGDTDYYTQKHDFYSQRMCFYGKK